MVGAMVMFSAAQACVLETGGSPSSVLIDYDVYSFQRAISSTSFEVRNDGDVECDLEVVIEDLGDFPPPFNYASAGVSIDVLAPGLQRPQSDQVINGIFSVILAPGEQRLVQLDFFTDQNAAIPAGNYSNDITIGIRERTSFDPLEEFVTSLAIVASPRAQINIAGSNGNFDKSNFTDFIDFDEPEVNESRQVFVQVRSNANTIMTIRSDNGGVMKHESSDTSYIRYVTSLDGTQVDLSSEVTLSNFSPTDLNGLSRPLEITIDELNNPLAGRYTDRIVIEIAAQ